MNDVHFALQRFQKDINELMEKKGANAILCDCILKRLAEMRQLVVLLNLPEFCNED